jgi:hypothetical protein
MEGGSSYRKSCLQSHRFLNSANLGAVVTAVCLYWQIFFFCFIKGATASSIVRLWISFPPDNLHDPLMYTHQQLGALPASVFSSELWSSTGLVPLNILFSTFLVGTAVAQWLRCCATNLKVAGSIPDGFIGIFHCHNPYDRTMALGST